MNGQKVGYARVSTTGQDFNLQRDRLADCDKIFEEKVSGARGTVRAELEKALNYMRDGDVFVVIKLDRLARSVLELMQITQALQDKKCDLQVLDQELDTSTSTGRLTQEIRDIRFQRVGIPPRITNNGEQPLSCQVCPIYD